MTAADVFQDRAGETIAELEAEIDALSAALGRCRKIGAAARIGTIAGLALFLASVSGWLRVDGSLFVVSVAVALGSVVLWGSNKSTGEQIAASIGTLEERRTALIEQIFQEAPSDADMAARGDAVRRRRAPQDR